MQRLSNNCVFLLPHGLMVDNGHNCGDILISLITIRYSYELDALNNHFS